MEQFDLVSTCGGGLEQLVEGEIKECGGNNTSSSKGVVTWQGTLESAYRLCLWSRFASRVLLQVDSFKVKDEESLYNGALKVQWMNHLDITNTFAVNCTIAGNSPITHNRYAALKLKDGLVDSFRIVSGQRPSVQGERPDVQIHLHLDGTQASVFIDLSGESLHRRGYRVSSTLAPLKETLAAAIVALSGWVGSEESLVDPMCGSGTLLIEAALIYGDSAPGLSRSYFGCFGWRGHDKSLWRLLVSEAMEREDAGWRKEQHPQLLGFDADPVAVSAARKNIERAGLEEQIRVKQRDVSTFSPPTKTGTIISNLPYGERLSEKSLTAHLYRAFGRVVGTRFSGWKVGVFISDPELTDSFKLTWENKHKLFNGAISCRLLTGVVPDHHEAPFVWRVTEPFGNNSTDEFANRLRKNLKKLMKWAAREKISCFRIYDRDLPEYNLSIDLYSKWVHIQEYAPPKSISKDLAESRLRDAIGSIKEILGVRSDRIFFKTRQRQRGRNQYQKKSSKKKLYEVSEGDCIFLVNFTDYLDTGLFLDHRPIRQRIYRELKGKRFLNLFGYTGTASIHAAKGGAASTTTVDLSVNYLEWSRKNLAVNGLSEINNKVIQADCLEWLREEKGTYDFIFIDPPTFSNTKKRGLVFDVQRDHITLIELAMAQLEKNGTVIFSTNFRKFKLDEKLGQQYDVINISAQSVPFDFSRNTKIHQCWQIHHRK